MAETLALLLSSAVMTAIAPVALKWIIDRLAGQARIWASPLLLVGLYVLGQWWARTAAEIRGLVYARAEQRIARTLTERLYAHLMSLPLRYHIKRCTGAVGQVIDSGLEGLQMILHHLVFTVLPVSVELVTVIAVLARVARPQYLALFCIAFACYAFVFGHSAFAISDAARGAVAARVEVGAAITDGLLNYETIKYFTAETLVQQKVHRALAQCERAWVAFYARYARNGLWVAGIFAVFLGTTLVSATRAVEAGRMTVGTFVLVNTYMLQLVRPVEMLGYAVQGLSHGVALLAETLTMLAERSEQTSTGTYDRPGGGTVEFQRVSLSYRPGRKVLDGVSFRLDAGHTLGVVGESGSGKSSLVRLLMGMVVPEDGRILIDGVPLSDLAIAQVRRAVAVVAQDTTLFNDTIGYNIAIGRPGARHADIEAAARVARVHEFIMTLPAGYDTVVGERGILLSGGERQRVSIARAVLRKPLIYVFDEATSSLDSRTEQGVLESLRELSRSSTTLVIAHRLSSVAYADEIVVLDSGRVLERGSHQALLRACGRYAQLWAAQQGSAAA